MLLVQDIAKKLEISEEDQPLLEGLKLAANTQTGEIVDWDHDYADDHTYDTEISNSELEFLKGRVSELDTQNKIKISFLELAVKIKNIDASKKTDKSETTEE